MSKPIPRSRLHITYRTKIDGTPKKAKLPMRFLVLGDFTAHDRSSLADREVHSIMPGMGLDSFMEELKLSARIDDRALGETLPGNFSGEIVGRWKAKPEIPEEGDAPTEAELKIEGTGRVSGDVKDNGFGSFDGEVEISGTITVPIKFEGSEPLVDDAAFKASADQEDGTSVGGVAIYGKVEPAAGTELGVTGVTGNVDALGRDAEFKPIRVPFPIEATTLWKNEAESEAADIALKCKVEAAAVDVQLTIPLRKMSHFKPSHLAGMVPEIRRLVLLQNLVLETRNYLANYPELRDMVKAELAAEGGGRFPALREELRTSYPQLLIDPKAAAASGDNPEGTPEESTPEETSA